MHFFSSQTRACTVLTRFLITAGKFLHGFLCMAVGNRFYSSSEIPEVPKYEDHK